MNNTKDSNIGSTFKCFGHRGAMGYQPENTIISFYHAIELGANWIELDVQQVEGNLIVFHDNYLDRTTNGSGLLKAQTFSALRKLDAGSGQQIPTLEEVFNLVAGRVGINIELKDPTATELVIDFVKSKIIDGWPQDKIIISSFNHKELKKIKKSCPTFSIGALFVGLPISNAAIAAELGADSVHISADYIDKDFVKDAHIRDLMVYAFTVNDLVQFDSLLDMGIDGVFSNYPDQIIARFNNRLKI